MLRIENLEFEQLMLLFLCHVPGDDDYYHVLGAQLANGYPSQLCSVLEVLSSCRLRGALFGLGQLREKKYAEIISLYLQNDNPIVVATAIDSLRIGGFLGWTRVEPLLKHVNPSVRAAAVRFALQAQVHGSQTYLLAALQDDSELVVESALDEADAFINQETVSGIEKLLSHSSHQIRVLAQAFVNQL
jgi:HEAT repeat protein